nr:MAG TPA: hypothetical protein [Caudoviricetes sp.]DAK22340.1 MAG TPA: hypothetical protein [Caudoviricetes sp.]
MLPDWRHRAQKQCYAEYRGAVFSPRLTAK